jgi:superfamily II DNA or RNA helicase
MYWSLVRLEGQARPCEKRSRQYCLSSTTRRLLPIMGDFFKGHHSDLRLFYGSSDSSGLRRAQVAAIWGLCAHAIETTDPGQAVLPTGTGKTAVIVAIPFALKASRVLVVTPSQVVRRQIAREFTTLSTLRRTGALNDFNDRPDVRSLGSQVRSEDSWALMRRHDVIVTTPQCVSPAYTRVVPPPDGFFDLVIVDEAHHEPAKTWRTLLEHFPTTRRLLLTATPFRRDRRGLSGEIVYWYSLHDAINDGVYSPIHFRAVRQEGEESPDDAVARAAIMRINSNEHRAARSQLVVRTDEISDALRLRNLYENNGLNLRVLSSKSSVAEVSQILEALESGAARGAVVVGVLTEGFDLPRLKIAAYHRKHKSLAATLQFIGRLSRYTGEPVQGELLAIPEVISGETRLLYDEDASWNELLPRIADTAVSRERDRREYSQEFSKPRGNYSRASIYPPKRIQCYKITDDGLREVHTLAREWPRTIVRSPVYDYATDSEGVVALTITRDLVHPPWILSDALDSFQYVLHLACLDVEHGYLFLSSETDASRRDLLIHFGLEEHAIEVSPERVNSVLHALGVEVYSSVGVRMSREVAQQGLSYQILTGRDAGRGVGPLDTSGSSAGHLIGRYRNGNEWHTVSASLETARIRESGEATLLDFRDWCFAISLQLDLTQTSNTPPGLSLPVRSSFNAYPQNAIGAILPEVFYSGELELEVDGTWTNTLATEVRVRSLGQRILVGFTIDRHIFAILTLDLHGRITGIRETDVRLHGQITTLSTLLANERPIQFYFSDGSTVVGNGLLSARGYHAALRSDMFEIWDWADVDIHRESRDPRAPYTKNIQGRTIDEFAARHPASYIIVDDGAGEIADIIVLEFLHERMLEFSLVHCKWSTEDAPGRRLDDLYQVMCQTVRSTRWGSPRTLLSEIATRLNSRPQTKCVKGNKDNLLSAISRYSGRGGFRGSLYAVQPGISHAALPGWTEGRNLIAACDDIANRVNMPLTCCFSP